MAKQKKIGSIHDIKECPDCGSDNIIYDDNKDQVICKDCGLIYKPLTGEKKKRK